MPDTKAAPSRAAFFMCAARSVSLLNSMEMKMVAELMRFALGIVFPLAAVAYALAKTVELPFNILVNVIEKSL
jgi:hypothetical protein